MNSAYYSLHNVILAKIITDKRIPAEVKLYKGIQLDLLDLQSFSIVFEVPYNQFIISVPSVFGPSL